MLKLSAKTKVLLLWFFAKPHLVEFLQIMVLFLISTARFTSENSVPLFLKFGPVWRIYRSRTAQKYFQM